MILAVRDAAAAAIQREAAREIQVLGAGRTERSRAVRVLAPAREVPKLPVDAVGVGITRPKREHPVVARIADIQPPSPSARTPRANTRCWRQTGGRSPPPPIIIRGVGGEGVELPIDPVGGGVPIGGVIEHPMVSRSVTYSPSSASSEMATGKFSVSALGEARPPTPS